MPSISTVMMALLAAINSIGFLYFRAGETQIKTPMELLSEYDYIIVGAGSAGSILAARLSEDANTSVLLLEAGPAEYKPWYHYIPGLTSLLQQTEIDWQYLTQPQDDFSRRAANQRTVWPRGKKLGGSSDLTYMIWNHGDTSEYDRWASYDGCSGWAYNDIKHYFRQMESVLFEADQTARGTTGPFEITKSFAGTPLILAMMAEAQSQGVKVNVDYNTPGNHQGWGATQVNIDSQAERGDTATVMLRPAMGRPNLHVVPLAHVRKVMFDRTHANRVPGQSPRATGVSYVWSDGAIRYAWVKKEVLLTAGAVNTPQLLLLSGVGDEKHLEEHLIPLVHPLPAVGRNLRDHTGLIMILSTNQTTAHGVTDFMASRDPRVIISALAEYLMRKTGPLATSGTALLNHQTSGLLPPEYQSDIQVEMFHLDITAGGQNAYLQGMDPEYIGNAFKDLEGRAVWTSLVVGQHPRSTGYIKLADNDYRSHPVIMPNYLKEDIDMKVMVAAVRSYISLLHSLPQYDIQWHGMCNDTYYDGMDGSDAFIECMVRDVGITVYHPMGTASMGADTRSSVVDNRLRVHGVTGLRVADLSVLPDSFGGNLQVPAMLIGWKAADLIRYDY